MDLNTVRPAIIRRIVKHFSREPGSDGIELVVPVLGQIKSQQPNEPDEIVAVVALANRTNRADVALSWVLELVDGHGDLYHPEPKAEICPLDGSTPLQTDSFARVEADSVQFSSQSFQSLSIVRTAFFRGVRKIRARFRVQFLRAGEIEAQCELRPFEDVLGELESEI